MKPKAILKISLDAAMTLGLLFQMGYQFWGDTAHEWVGAGMFVLFIAHHILNWRWYQALFHGRYTPVRIFGLLMDLLVLLVMVGLMVSGIMLSREVFAFLPISGGMSFARLLHLVVSHWGFVLMALHLGLHWKMVMGQFRRGAKGKQPSRLRFVVLTVLGAAIAVYGLTAFFRRELPAYLFLQTQFAFFDFSEPVILFYLDYLAMMGLFIWLSHYLTKLLGLFSRRKTGTSSEVEDEK